MTKHSTIAAQALRIEAEALIKAAERMDDSFGEAVESILACRGKVIVTGVGKSGLVGAKIAATLASTGTPSFFVHPTEALHGDLGMVGKEDMLLAISYSGESSELSAILPHLKRLGVPIIAMSKSPQSALGRVGEIWLDISVAREACPLGIAPTSSTTLTMAMGDALAVALMQARNFTKEAFASFHPGGSLGRALFVTVESLMRRENLPLIAPTATLREALVVMSEGRLGTAFLVDESKRLVGIISDGDIRRALVDANFSLEIAVAAIANKEPKTIQDPAMLAIDALELIETHKIQLLAVIDGQHRLQGAIHLHTLIEAGITHASK